MTTAADMLVGLAQVAVLALVEGAESQSDREKAKRALAELDAIPRPRSGQRARLMAIARGMDPDAVPGAPGSIEEAARAATLAPPPAPAIPPAPAVSDLAGVVRRALDGRLSDVDRVLLSLHAEHLEAAGGT